MVRYIIFTLSLFHAFSLLQAQHNLVPDPSFECDSVFIAPSSCVYYSEDRRSNTKPEWDCYWMGVRSSDLYDLQPGAVCNTTTFEDNNYTTHTGKRMAGIYNWSEAKDIHGNLLGLSNQEMLATYLKKDKLESNVTYFVRLYSKPSKYPIYYYFTDLIHSPHVALGFYEGSYTDYTAAIPDALYRLPEVHIAAERTRYDTLDFERWYRTTGCYTATGKEELLLIGNHTPHIFSDFFVFDSSLLVSHLSYLLIDDVFVGEVPDFSDILSDTTLCKGDAFEVRPPRDSFLKDLRLYHNGQLQEDWVFSEAGRYTINAVYGECPIEHQFEIEVQECEGCQVFIPNAFSPNGDGRNDYLSIGSNCQLQVLSVEVYDRWGSQVFHETAPELGRLWAGYAPNGRLLKSGVYAYHIRYAVDQVEELSPPRSAYGHVAVMR